VPVADIDLLTVERGTVVSPAGCGKTELIAQSLTRHHVSKPALILTHTNAGVAALRGRLDRRNVPPKAYRLGTIDGWAMRLIQTFPSRAMYNPDELAQSRPDYPKIRDVVWKLLKTEHLADTLSASYDRLIVDECQDCAVPQFAIVYYAAESGLPTCVLGDPMQAIFDFAGKLTDWDEHVLKYFPVVGELETPWRWKNAGTEPFGLWLLDVRRKLVVGEAIDLRSAPQEVAWVHLDGTDDHGRKLAAARTRAPGGDGSVLIIEDSARPARQRDIASQTPGAVTVENVDLRDLVEFARDLDLTAPDALRRIVTFAGNVMTNVGAADLLQRVASLQRGTARRAASDVEQAALAFEAIPSARAAIDLLVEINRQGGVRAHRDAVLRGCIRALQTCDGTPGNTFHDAAIRERERSRFVGRPVPRRAVGSTLLLKGLEADVSVVLNAADLNPRNLYVAMTRGSKTLVICSPSPILNPK
jgi:DNA helicase-2/ATP-dependent DNA helicase PcrA